MRTILKLTLFFLIGTAFFLASTSDLVAQDTRKKIIYRKKTTVDFDDAVVEGKGKNPEGVYVVTPPKRKFKGLLRLRTNFHKELIRDTLLLK